MKGKEHYRTVEDYLQERGWIEHPRISGYWRAQTGNQTYSTLGAFHRQLVIDCDTEGERRWQVAGITLERI